MMPKKCEQSQLRIIAGKWRGRKITFPATSGLRPTGDRIRETVFNWLAPYIREAKCLDLFAGSGALGFEALSRGAKFVTFVDLNKTVTKFISDNCQMLQANNCEILQIDANKIILLNKAFDIIFLDPPFHKNLLPPILKTILEYGILNKNGVIYIEVEPEFDLSSLETQWEVLKFKKAGQVRYALIKNVKK